jgi:hypothetical protein
MTITARGVAIVCGAALGGFGLLGLVIGAKDSSDGLYLLGSWLLPIGLFPAAALAAALDSDIERGVAGQATVLWPTYAGLVVYAAESGACWLEVSSRGTHENFAALFMLLVMAVHAAVFLIGGGLFALFPRTRPAGFQLWLAYPILLLSWIGGSFAL